MPASRALIELPERYRPLRHIANGGMASVWEAEDCLLRREVAIKLLSPNLAESHRATQRFEREARAAAGLSQHANCVTIYDIGEHEGRPFIVMEVLPGGSLADRLRDGDRPSREEATRWLGQAAAALDAAHAKGIVHRDVKPGNILFDEHDRVVLGDFGIARLAYDPTITTTGEILGTAAYISPEQADGAQATAASDRYALAVVAFELLTGTRPFSTGNFAATARQHIEMPPPAASDRNPALPPAVDDVLRRGLAKDPAERWPTAVAFVDALEEALADAPDDALETATQVMPARRTPTPPPPQPAPPRPAAAQPPREPLPRPDVAHGRRGPRTLLLAGLGLLALLLVAVAVLAASGGEDGESGGERAAQPEQRERTREPTRTEPAEEPAAPAAPAPEEQPSASDEPESGGGGDPSALQAEGFSLMSQGRYDEAIPVLERAMEACGRRVEPTDPCAYAAFNLGKSLIEAGRPGEAIPWLELRLTNPDQRDTVQAELDRARSLAGGGGAGPGNGNGRGNGKGKPQKNKGD